MADTVVINNSLLQHEGEYALGVSSPPVPSLHLRLFVNNITPACGDTTATYTEPSDGSYAAIALSYGGWSGSTVSCVTTYTYSPSQVFSLTGTGYTIYGHYYTDSTTATVWWAVLWATAYVMPSGGANIEIVPIYVKEQCTAP